MQQRNLVARLKRHQPQALEDMMQKYTPYVATIIRNIVGKYLSESDVEELTTDVFVSVWEHADQLKPWNFSGYLVTIARNCAKNRIRSYRHTENLEDLIDVYAEDDVEETIEAHVLSNVLHDVLHMLSAKDREILIRYYYSYESVKQIAQEMCITESAVKMRMSRLRKKMQEELIARGYGYEDSPAVKHIGFSAGTKGVTL